MVSTERLELRIWGAKRALDNMRENQLEKIKLSSELNTDEYSPEEMEIHKMMIESQEMILEMVTDALNYLEGKND